MGGPIVRTGTTPKFWQNWEHVFGGKKSGTKKSATSTAKAAPAKELKGPKKASTTKAVAKKVKKASGKKK